MKVRNVKVVEEDWRNLLILDACRYDYFERNYEDFLEGNLSKRGTLGTHTLEWLKNNFDDGRYDDIVYVSANPFVNSIGAEQENWDPKGKFHKIYDVWDTGWKEEVRTTPPWEVNKIAKEAKAKYPDKRMVIHYIQPHAPYLTLEPKIGPSEDIRKYARLKPNNPKKDSPETPLRVFNARFEKVGRKVGKLLRKTVGHKITTEVNFALGRLKDKLGIVPKAPIVATVDAIGVEGLRQVYEDNLKICLKYVSELTEKFPGKTVISADHGEMLGLREEGQYGHPKRKHDIEETKIIPWLEVSGVVE